MTEELHTPVGWADMLGIHILDPDGWRGADAPAWDEPISRGEFDRRAAMSTTGPAWGAR